MRSLLSRGLLVFTFASTASLLAHCHPDNVVTPPGPVASSSPLTSSSAVAVDSAVPVSPMSGIPADPPGADDAEVAKAAKEYLDLLVSISPESATQLGIHDHDGELDDYTLDGAAKKIDQVDALLASIDKRFAKAKLSRAATTDLTLIQGSLRVQVRTFRERKPLDTQPDTYVRPLNTLFLMYAREYAPAAQRAKLVLERVEKLPAVLALGKANLKRPAKVWTQIGIDRAKGGVTFLTEITPFLTKALPADKARIDAAIATAKKAFVAYGTFLEKDLLPRSDGQFAAGKDYFTFMLREDASLRESPDALHAQATELVTKIQAKMVEVARKIEPNAKDWPEVVAKVKAKHPTAPELLASYRKEVLRAREFLVKKDVVPFPEGDDCQVIDTPPFQRSTITAAYDQPPPFEASTRGFFFVTPVEPTMSAKEKEEMLRENDFGDIVDTAVHETYPGHHLQLSIARRNPSLIRKISGPSIFAEGWALYSEELMAELGYYTDEERIMQLEWALVRAARVLIDVGLHTRGMSFDDGVKVLTDTVHLEPALALSEIKRYTQEPTQPLSYIIGREQIFRLRDRYKAKMGEKFSLKEFHREVLTRGTLAPGLLAREILGEDL